MLVTEYVGFRQSYLHQFLIRQFRCHVSTLAEVSTILQAVPDSYQCNEHGIEVHLLAAMKCCMCLREGRHSPWLTVTMSSMSQTMASSIFSWRGSMTPICLGKMDRAMLSQTATRN